MYNKKYDIISKKSLSLKKRPGSDDSAAEFNPVTEINQALKELISILFK
jgi:hypothetical protein